MFRRIRSLVATFAAVALLAGAALPASAGALEDIDENSVPIPIDLVVQRPLGLAATAAGAVLFVPAAALTAVFSPKSVPNLFNTLVRGPFDFTFRDPLGTHGTDRGY